MKHLLIKISILASFASVSAVAQTGDMHGMDMKERDRNGMKMESSSQAAVHEAKGVVKQVDKANGLVTIAHGPVATLKWQAMTMPFKVKDKSLLEALRIGKEVKFSFVQRGGDYVLTKAE